MITTLEMVVSVAIDDAQFLENRVKELEVSVFGEQSIICLIGYEISRQKNINSIYF